MQRINIATLLLISMLSTAKAKADDIPDYADTEFGEYLSSQCVTCHKNNSSKGIPAIVGKDYHYLVSLLEGYRSKELKNNVMRLQAGNLSDEEIASLSLYFSKLELD